MLNIQPATLRNTLEQLEHAVQDHLDWHAQLLRAIVCETQNQNANAIQAYRALGTDPTRYRGSNEALVRRIVQGKGLYRVNTVVDVNNLLSLETLQRLPTYPLAGLAQTAAWLAQSQRCQSGDAEDGSWVLGHTERTALALVAFYQGAAAQASTMPGMP